MKISLPLFALGFGALLVADPNPTLKQYCTGCHGKAATAGINLEQLTAAPMTDGNFAQWQKVAAVLEEKRMPPAKMPQPTDAERSAAAQWVRASLNTYSRKTRGRSWRCDGQTAYQRRVRLYGARPYRARSRFQQRVRGRRGGRGRLFEFRRRSVHLGHESRALHGEREEDRRSRGNRVGTDRILGASGQNGVSSFRPSTGSKTSTRSMAGVPFRAKAGFRSGSISMTARSTWRGNTRTGWRLGSRRLRLRNSRRARI